jgi:hypothetical protein
MDRIAPATAAAAAAAVVVVAAAAAAEAAAIRPSRPKALVSARAPEASHAT